MLEVLPGDGLPLLRRVALTEKPLEQLARIGFHRERRGWRPERDRCAVAAAVGAVARPAIAAASLGRHLERRQRRVLAEVRRGDLVDGHAAKGFLALPRRHTAQPRRRVEGVHRRRDRRLVLQPAHDRQLLLERREGLENRRELEALALGGGRPLVHDRAVGQIHEPHARFRARRGLRQGGPCRNHRIQQRQAHGDAGAAEERAPGKVLLGDEHD